MKNVPLTNANRRIGPPKGWDSVRNGDCLTISAVHVIHPTMGPSFTTCWQPSKDEIRQLIDGGVIQLTYYVPQHPVMNIGVLHDGKLSELEA